MDELHRDLREVFERQQARMGGLAGVRERVMRDALAGVEARRRRPLRLVAGLAGGLLVILFAAALVGTLMLSRERARPGGVPAATPTAAPTPAPSATPLHATQPLRVAASDPVILFRDPTDLSQLDGVSWDGKALGRVGPADRRSGLFTSPSGSLYASGQQVYDRSGTAVGAIDMARVSSVAWADDGRHYCRVDHARALPPPGGEPATLRLAAPGEAARTVVQLGTVGQQWGVGVAACSVSRDRAVLVQGSGQGTTSSRMWVVQLSDGRVLWSRSFVDDGFTITRVVASSDAQTVAEVAYRCCQGDRPGPPATTVYDGAGRTVARVDGGIQGFSWDGSLAVVLAEGATADAAQVTVTRWRDGTVVWTAPAGLAVSGVAAEPGGQRLAIGLQSRSPQPANQSGFPSADVYTVGPDGRALLLLRAVPF